MTSTSGIPDVLTWNPFHNREWPRLIARPEEYDGSERLRLSYDLGAVPEKEKKQVIKGWCEKLPKSTNLRWLNFWSHVTPPLFDAACEVRGLECLQIKWSNVKSVKSICNLQSLHYLRIGSSTKVESIEPLTSLSKLRLLDLENFKLITDFSPLLSLTSLESLIVGGSMWTRQDVGSVETFAQMTWLRSLAIDTTYVKSLQPLANLKQLKYLDMGGKLPMEEYAWLSAKLPNTECRWFEPYFDVSSAGFSPCKKCGQKLHVMLTGKRGGVLCKSCDAEKIRKHEQEFAAARAAAS